jgi:hypothetical protein
MCALSVNHYAKLLAVNSVITGPHTILTIIERERLHFFKSWPFLYVTKDKTYWFQLETRFSEESSCDSGHFTDTNWNKQ